MSERENLLLYVRQTLLIFLFIIMTAFVMNSSADVISLPYTTLPTVDVEDGLSSQQRLMVRHDASIDCPISDASESNNCNELAIFTEINPQIQTNCDSLDLLINSSFEGNEVLHSCGCPVVLPSGLIIDSRSGEWSGRFGSEWPSDNASEPMAVKINRYRSMSFTTTAEGVMGKLTLQATPISGGSAVIKFSTQCGDFSGATNIFEPCAKLTVGNFGSITWEQTVGSVDLAVCRLQPNTNYYLNITYGTPEQLGVSSCPNSTCSALYGPDAN